MKVFAQLVAALGLTWTLEFWCQSSKYEWFKVIA